MAEKTRTFPDKVNKQASVDIKVSWEIRSLPIVDSTDSIMDAMTESEGALDSIMGKAKAEVTNPVVKKYEMSALVFVKLSLLNALEMMLGTGQRK